MKKAADAQHLKKVLEEFARDDQSPPPPKIKNSNEKQVRFASPLCSYR